MTNHLKTVTQHHNTIKQWVETRGGRPCVEINKNNETEFLQIHFPDLKKENLRFIGWDEWFRIFDRNNLAFWYQEQTEAGEVSLFNEIVDQETAINPNHRIINVSTGITN